MSADMALNRLMRGISTDDVETVRDARRAVLECGDQAVPPVQA